MDVLQQRYPEGRPVIMIVPSASDLGGLILHGNPDGVVVTQGSTGEVLSDTRPAVIQQEAK